MAEAEDHVHAALIARFFEAFTKLDGEAMAACYHAEVRYSDPVFPSLQGERAGLMWCMLTSRASDRPTPLPSSPRTTAASRQQQNCLAAFWVTSSEASAAKASWVSCRMALAFAAGHGH